MYCILNGPFIQQAAFRPGHIIEMLVDVVSKNGTMLLNILQRPDGSVDDEMLYILNELASWTSCCGEAVAWTETDFRFTSKGNTVYAYIMKAPQNRVSVIRSFALDEKITSVRLLGAGEVPYSQNFGMVTVKLPDTLPTAYANCLAIECFT